MDNKQNVRRSPRVSSKFSSSTLKRTESVAPKIPTKVANVVGSDRFGSTKSTLAASTPAKSTTITRNATQPIKPAVKSSVGRSNVSTMGRPRTTLCQTTKVAAKVTPQTAKVAPQTTKATPRARWDLKGRYEDLSETFKNAKKEYEDNLNNLKKEKEDIIEASGSSWTRIKELETVVQSLKEEIDNFKAEVSSYSQIIQGKDSEISSLHITLEEERVHLIKFKDENYILKSDLHSLTDNYTCLKQSHQELSAFAEETNSNLQDTLLKLTNAERSIEEFTENAKLCQKQLADQDMERRKLHHRVLELRGTVRVACRVRPKLTDEASKQHCSIDYTMEDNKLTINSNIPKDSVTGTKVDSEDTSFTFDNFFGPTATQNSVFDEIDPLVQSALDGYNVCVFAYGQTGSGKTFTMEGSNEFPGMIPRSVTKIFQSMAPMERNGWKYKIHVSFIEVYNDNLRDLLQPVDEKSGLSKLDLKIVKNQNSKDGELEVLNLRVEQVFDPQQIFQLLKIANSNRQVAATKCNIHSSRSHSIFQLKLTGANETLNETSSGTVNLIDLAGSERLKDSKAVGDRLTETRFINSSLSALKKVMLSLSNKDSHISFRDTKLTYLLQPALAGNSKSLMFVNISPLQKHYKETVSSLRFASVVNQVQIGVATQHKKKLGI